MCFKTKVSLLLLALFIGAGVFSMNVHPAEAASLAELQQIIEQFKKQIAELQERLTAVQQGEEDPGEWCHTFNRNLKYGDKSNEVNLLQLALDKEGVYGPPATKFTDRGGYFGPYTASAVVGFQEKYTKEVLSQWGLKHGTGFVGKSTRAKLNKLYGCGITPVSPVPLVPPVPPVGECNTKCQAKGYETGVCRTWVVVPDTEWGCKDNEFDIGQTSDCTTFTTTNGIDEIIVGVGKTCCCQKEGQEEGNFPPVIDGITAPTQLRVNEKGVWTIKARDPENGALSYSVNWGDEYANIALPGSDSAEQDTRTQTTTFTHSYNRAGTYTIRFTVTDDHNQTARTSTIVKVVSSETTCTDSDGGINKYVRGRTCRDLYNFKQNSNSSDPTTTSSSFGRFCRTDRCIPLPDGDIGTDMRGYLTEYYCKDNKIFSKTIHCTDGCANGACLEVQEECAKEGEQVNRNPLMGPTDRQCCEGLVENRVSRSYSICEKPTEEPTPSITVISPNGGETWVAGNTYTIRWTSNTESSRVVIDILNEQGKCANSEDELPAVVANNEAIEWVIPTNFSSGQYKMRVMICPVSMSSQKCANIDLKQYGFDESDDYFSIVAAEEELTCNTKCQAKGYDKGICRDCADVPSAEWGCRTNELDIGGTSDCTLPQGSVGTSWTARSAAKANSWTSVTYGNGLFVSLTPSSDANQVMTSPDGITWTARSAAEANSWTSVTYGNGLFVAVASSSGTDQVMTSPDGITWTARSAAEANSWTSVTYGNGLFVAVAFTGENQVMTSPDGITWTARSAVKANGWTSATYGNGLFVAVAHDSTNQVMTSPDGITWTARSCSAVEADNWYSVTYGNGLFVAVAPSSGTDQVMTSPDGITWTARSAAEANSWRSVTYGNGLFVAVAHKGANRVMTSPDGVIWTARLAAEANYWNSVTYGNGLFVAVASSGTKTNQVMTLATDQTCCCQKKAETTPSITVTYPNGGEEWVIGETHRIKWECIDGIDSVKINLWVPYNVLGGSSVKYLATVPSSLGYYDWTILSDLPGRAARDKFKTGFRDRFKITVQDLNDYKKNDDSDDYFSIVAAETHACTDTDGGKDYYTKGTTKLNGQEKVDVCRYSYMDSDHTIAYDCVMEYFCQSNNLIGEEKNYCPNGCSDGACIKGDEPYCANIGTRSEGWIGVGIPDIQYENCDGCYAECKAIGSKSEGWYSSGSCETSGKLIKYDNCGEGQEEPSITVTYPNGGEEWVVGQRYEIKWEQKGLGGEDIYIGLLIRNKKDGTLISGGSYFSRGAIANQESYHWFITDWQVPEPHKYKYKIVIARKGEDITDMRIMDESDDYFSIVAAGTSVCTDSDGGINQYVKGTACRPSTVNDGLFCRTDRCIPLPDGDYSGTDMQGYLTEYYCKDDKMFSKTIHCENGCANGACLEAQEECAGEGEQVNRNPLMGPTDRQCCEGLVENKVSKSYSICEKPTEEPTPSITVISPNGGEEWVVGQAYDIKWATSNWPDNTPVQISLNPMHGGDHFIMLTPNDGIENYTVPSEGIVPGNNFIIKMHCPTETGNYNCPNDVAVYDSSDDYFSIVAVGLSDCHTSPLWKWDYCSPGCKCNDSEGDCDTDVDCAEGLFCAKNVGANYGQDSRIDVCEKAQNTTY